MAPPPARGPTPVAPPPGAGVASFGNVQNPYLERPPHIVYMDPYAPSLIAAGLELLGQTLMYN
ncbi:hypothetical protein Ciccas_006761 [Cichlidogyrus casuarinus]|uniref:Uncharacterized protein n=1 Tax=Cichlidogyrus casuarinus TaxID=1844966 RepID=A0ABD2Q5X2_9PLAT